MIDAEKVIKGLEDIQKHLDTGYSFAISWKSELIRDALALLKEHEAVEPITEHRLFLCPVCKNTLFREQKFCHECGKRIEWEGW